MLTMAAAVATSEMDLLCSERKEKAIPFSANPTRSQASYRAAQVLQRHSLHKLTMVAAVAGVSASAQP